MATILYVFEITFHDFNTGKMFMCFLGILIHIICGYMVQNRGE